MEAAPTDGKRPAGRARRRLWIGAALGVLLILLLAGGALVWHFSSQVLVPDHSGWPEDVEVVGVTPRTISLERNEETARQGLVGVTWQGGHATAGRILAREESSVTRRLLGLRGFLVAGLKVGIDWNVYAGNPRQTLGLPFADVPIESELGPMPAWRMPPAGTAPGPGQRRSTWAIFVHGINSSRQSGLRLAPALHEAGLQTLVISYRDDLGAPSSPDGYHHMGQTEWRDLQAAARYAFAHGARRLVLVGFSMGGSIVAQFMEKSPLAERVAGLVLDAPALDWKEILSFNATEKGFPAIGAIPVEWAIGARIEADWDSLDAARHGEDFQLPILLFHGEEDDLVPISISDEFAAELPQWVTYYRVPGAGHTQSWNVNPRLYDERLKRFLAGVLGHGVNPTEPAGQGRSPAP